MTNGQGVEVKKAFVVPKNAESIEREIVRLKERIVELERKKAGD